MNYTVIKALNNYFLKSNKVYLQNFLIFLKRKVNFIKDQQQIYCIKNLIKGDLDELFCLYQPKLNLKDNSISEFEALARIKYMDRIISPVIFIPLAEKINLIHKIDYKIIELNMKLILKLLEEDGYKNLLNIKIAINISIKTLERSDFIFKITQLLKKYNLDGKYFEIELIETISIKDFNLFYNKIIELKKLGIDVSLDDFTAGFSSFYILALIPISKIKIDKSLLANYNTIKGEIIYTRLIKLLNSLKLDIVAEGIETDIQLEFLKKQKIQYAQGYLIGKPDSIEKFYNIKNYSKYKKGNIDVKYFK